MVVQELFDAVPIAATGVLFAAGKGNGVAGFFCTTAGTITLQDAAGAADIVSAFAVAAGTFYPMPFGCPNGAKCVIAGGAAGTWAVAR
jgi:hypothetical protein